MFEPTTFGAEQNSRVRTMPLASITSDKKLRFLQINTFYDLYLEQFYKRNPTLSFARFSDQIAALIKDGFSANHMFAAYMQNFGWESELVIANALPLQAKWVEEFGGKIDDPAQWRAAIVRAQIEKYRPDVLYLADPIEFDSRFLRTLQFVPPYIVGWRAAEIPVGTDWSMFDLALSHLSNCREKALVIGAKAAKFFYPGVPRFCVDETRDTPKEFDVVFSGQWTPQHHYRNQLITDIATASERGDFSFGLFLASHHFQLPAPVAKLNRGGRFGIEMFRALRSGEIVINAEIDLAGKEAGNSRLFEATAMGSFLLTEHNANIERYFTPGVEIETFSSPAELLEKIRYYCAHPEERRRIATRGQEKSLQMHGMDTQVAVLNSLLRENLTAKFPKENRYMIENSSNAESAHTPSPRTTTIVTHESSPHIPASPPTPEQLNAMLQEALSALNRGAGAEALAIAEKVHGWIGDVSGLNYLRVLCFNAADRHEEALAAAQRELEITPTHNAARGEYERLSRLLQKKTARQLNPEQRPYNSSIPLATLTSIQSACQSSAYHGVPMVKSPFDFALYPQLVWNYKPRTIIEIGSKKGGSALWMGDLTQNFGLDCHIYSIDTVQVNSVSHPHVTFMGGNPQQLNEVITADFLNSLPRPLLVIESGDQSYETSSAVLNFFHPHLRAGEYIVMENGIMSDLQQDPNTNSGPHRALKQFFYLHPGEYDVDAAYTDHFGYNSTWCTNGFLRKKKYSLNQTISKNLIREFNLDDPAPLGATSQMSQNERFQMYFALRECLPKDQARFRFVEVGSFAGASLRLIHTAAHRISRTIEGFCVEPSGEPEFYKTLQEFSRTVSHLKAFSYQAAPQLEETFNRSNWKPNFIFIDGDHGYEGVKQDALSYYPLLAPGGVIMFHDYLPALNDENRTAIFFHHGGKEPGIRQACEEVMEQTFGLTALELPLLYPTDPTQTQPHLPVIPGVFSTIRAYRKPA